MKFGSMKREIENKKKQIEQMQNSKTFGLKIIHLEIYEYKKVWESLF